MLDQPIVVVSLDLICLMLASVPFIEGAYFCVDALRTDILTTSHAINSRNHVLISEMSSM